MSLSQKQIEQAVQAAVRIEQAVQAAVREAKTAGVVVVVEVEDTGFFPTERTYLKVTVHPEKLDTKKGA